MDGLPGFRRADTAEKARPLSLVTSNCVRRDGGLTVTYRQPFDVVADAGMREGDRAEVEVRVLKDKRWGPGEQYRQPSGRRRGYGDVGVGRGASDRYIFTTQ